MTTLQLSKALDTRKQRKNLIKQLDTLFSLKVKDRDNWTCQMCKRQMPVASGKSSLIQCAHFYSRAIKSLRWEMDNSVALCAGCHINVAHKQPKEFSDWFLGHIGQERLTRLTEKKSNRMKTDVQSLKLLLRSLE